MQEKTNEKYFAKLLSLTRLIFICSSILNISVNKSSNVLTRGTSELKCCTESSFAFEYNDQLKDET